MAIVALALVAALATVLIVPVHIDLACDTRPQPPTQRVRMRLRWLMFVWLIGPAGRDRRRSRQRPRPRPPSPWRSRGRRLLAAIETPGFLTRVRRLLVELLRALAPRTAYGWLRFGLDDPASTGAVFGLAQALAGCVGTAGWRLRLEPEFAGPAFAARARVHWVLRPWRVLWPVGTFLASPATWRAAAAAARTHRQRSDA